MMKFSINDLTLEELKTATKALEGVTSDKTVKKAPAKKKPAKEDEEEREEVESDFSESEDEDADPDFDAEDEEEYQDEEELEDDEAEEEKTAKKKPTKDAPVKKETASIEGIVKAAATAHAHLTKKLKSKEKSQAKVNSIFKKYGAKNSRTLPLKHFTAALKDLKALVA